MQAGGYTDSAKVVREMLMQRMESQGLYQSRVPAGDRAYKLNQITEVMEHTLKTIHYTWSRMMVAVNVPL